MGYVYIILNPINSLAVGPFRNEAEALEHMAARPWMTGSTAITLMSHLLMDDLADEWERTQQVAQQN
jgi:hypothetical protein